MNQHIENLILVTKENPELPIITATYHDVIAEDWGYWCGSIEQVKVDFFYLSDERWYAGEEDIKDTLADILHQNEYYASLTKEKFNLELNTKFNTMITEGKIKKAIIIFITLPE